MLSLSESRRKVEKAEQEQDESGIFFCIAVAAAARNNNDLDDVGLLGSKREISFPIRLWLHTITTTHGLIICNNQSHLSLQLFINLLVWLVKAAALADYVDTRCDGMARKNMYSLVFSRRTCWTSFFSLNILKRCCCWW